MTALATNILVDQLHLAGLSLTLAPAGGLAVGPSSRLTSDLRDLIRSSKAQLVDWLTAANDANIQVSSPPDDPLDWKELAAVYYAHHFQCPTCIAAGKGLQYGRRCETGLQFWNRYADQRIADGKFIDSDHPLKYISKEHDEE